MHKRYSLLFAGALALGACNKDEDVRTLPDPGSNSTAPDNGSAAPSAQGPTTQPNGNGVVTTNGVETRQQTTTPGTQRPTSGAQPSTGPSTSTTGGSSNGSTSTSQTTSSTTTTDQTSSAGNTTGTEPTPKKRMRWTKGHGDIRISWDETKNTLAAKLVLDDSAFIDGKQVDEGKTLILDPDDVVAITSNTYTRVVRSESDEGIEGPLFDALCIPMNGTMSYLSASDTKGNPPSPFYGFNNRIKSKFPVKKQQTTLTFLDVQGPGPGPHNLAIWAFAPDRSKSKFLVSTCEGPNKSNTITKSYGHSHYNMGFSSGSLEGKWDLSVKATSELKDGGTVEVSFPLHFEFIKAP